MKTFKSIDDLKCAAEFFPKGKIVPRRILKVLRKLSSRVTFGADTWVLNTPKGHLCAVDHAFGNCAVYIRGFKNALIVGSPYTPDGGTHWIGNYNAIDAQCVTDAQWLEQLNKAIKEHFQDQFGSAA